MLDSTKHPSRAMVPVGMVIIVVDGYKVGNEVINETVEVEEIVVEAEVT